MRQSARGYLQVCSEALVSVLKSWTSETLEEIPATHSVNKPPQRKHQLT